MATVISAMRNMGFYGNHLKQVVLVGFSETTFKQVTLIGLCALVFDVIASYNNHFLLPPVYQFIYGKPIH